MEQLVARKAHNLEVVRSSRAPATKLTSQAIGIHRGVEQLVARKAHNLEVIRSSRVSATQLRTLNCKSVQCLFYFTLSPILIQTFYFHYRAPIHKENSYIKINLYFYISKNNKLL